MKCEACPGLEFCVTKAEKKEVVDEVERGAANFGRRDGVSAQKYRKILYAAAREATLPSGATNTM